MKITEDNFVEQLKKHNEQALVYVIDTYGWVLKTVVKRQMSTLEYLWDDCMNDTLLAVWNNIDSFRPEKNEFQNWLAGVCRSKEDPVEQMPEWKDEKAEKEFLQKEYEEEVETILSYLKEEDARIFRMIYLQDMTMDEVSEKMQMSKTVIYGRISRGKKQIRRSLVRNEV